MEDVQERAWLLMHRITLYFNSIEYNVFTSPIILGAIGGATLLYFSPFLFDEGPAGEETIREAKAKKGKRGMRHARKKRGKKEVEGVVDKDEKGKEKEKEEGSEEESDDKEAKELKLAMAELERVTEAKAAALREYGLEDSVDRIKKLMGEFGNREKARRFARVFRLLDWLILIVLVGILLYFIQAQYGFSAGHGWVIFEYYFPREANVIAAFTGRPSVLVSEQASRHVLDLSGVEHPPVGFVSDRLSGGSVGGAAGARAGAGTAFPVK